MTRFEELAKAYSLEYFGKPLMEAGVEGIDVLDDDQTSAIPETEESGSSDIGKLLLLTNILLKAAKFKPSDEVVAYLNMPRFKTLSPFSKLTAVRNLISDHPEMIVQEAEGDEGAELEDGENDMEPPMEGEVEDFGEAELELDEASEEEILNLTLRVLEMDPYSLPSTLRTLPSRATEENYEEIITALESILV
jgi:hypothetical protein